MLYIFQKRKQKNLNGSLDIFFTPMNNSFYVELVERRVYEGDVIHFPYPKYEFLDKMKEWGCQN